ncbi:MAG: tetratricopeptide repeat protein [Salinivirgaceae bacterium]|jgi:tetratricopeptide (TPR) repeat protein|nr:tetratricopeptide repeat protein [Salinivirgaceae bacterium]
MYRVIFILILGFIVGCKSIEVQQTIQQPNLTAKEVSTIESSLIDFKRTMLYDETEKGLTYLDKALAIDSTHPVALYERSKIYFEEKNYTDALVDIQMSINRDPNNLVYRKFQIAIAQKSGDIDLSNKFILKILDDYSDKEELWYVSMDHFLTTEQYEKALEILNRYEEKFGFNEQVLVNKYKLNVQLERFKNLEKELIIYSEKYTENTKVLALLGEFYFSTSRINKGIEVYRKLLTIDPSNTDALLAMADYYRSNLEFKKSFNYIEKALNSPDLEVEGKITILLRFMELSKQDPQLNFYFTTLVENLKVQYSTNSDVRLLYANVLVTKELYEEAKKEFELALEENPDNFQAWIKLIMIDNELKSNELIIEHATKALEYFPNQAELYYYRGLANMLSENYNSAIEDLKFGNKITGKTDPLKFQFYYFLAESHYNLKNYEESFKYYDLALEIQPNEISLLNNYAYYLSELNQNLDKAHNMSLKTIKEEPKNFTYLDTYAWILFKMEKYSEAVDFIERAIINGGSNSSVIMEHYGDILYKVGREEEAITTWIEADKLPNPTENLKIKIERKEYVE